MEIFLLASGYYVNLDLSIWVATGNGLFCRPCIFRAHAIMIYREVLISLRSSALGLVI